MFNSPIEFREAVTVYGPPLIMKYLSILLACLLAGCSISPTPTTPQPRIASNHNVLSISGGYDGSTNCVKVVCTNNVQHTFSQSPAWGTYTCSNVCSTADTFYFGTSDCSITAWASTLTSYDGSWNQLGTASWTQGTQVNGVWVHPEWTILGGTATDKLTGAPCVPDWCPTASLARKPK